MSAPTDQFPRDTSWLPAATTSEIVELSPGQRFQLRIAPDIAEHHESGMMFSFDVAAAREPSV